jgi:hypothetical protein
MPVMEQARASTTGARRSGKMVIDGRRVATERQRIAKVRRNVPAQGGRAA